MNTKIYKNVKDLIKDLLTYKVVINVKSEKEATEFIHIMRNRFNVGWKYNSEKITHYEYFKEQTCYAFGLDRMLVGEINDYKKDKVEIIPYSSIRELLIGK